MIYGKLKIVYHDTAIVVVEKPGGMLSVPGRGPDKQDCVTSRLKMDFPQMITQPAVHRLDMYTSGLLVVAITAAAHRSLNRQFMERGVSKRYQAIIDGQVQDIDGEIRLPFRLDPDNRPLQIHDPVHGKMGVTRWRNLGTEGNRSRIQFTPLTGRTHQLRVHSAHPLGLGYPIVGDNLYGNGRDGDRMLLHAEFLEFEHPETGDRVAFHSAPPF